MTNPTQAEARHQIANLLHTYTDIADRKDVRAAVELLGGADVRFPHDGFSDAAEAPAFFQRLWAGPQPHRHDVTNLIINPDAGEHRWTARAHYTRWVFGPDPELHTLGEYTLVVDDSAWSIIELRVTRSWTRA